jgi:hypothetical protein
MEAAGYHSPPRYRTHHCVSASEGPSASTLSTDLSRLARSHVPFPASAGRGRPLPDHGPFAGSPPRLLSIPFRAFAPRAIRSSRHPARGYGTSIAPQRSAVRHPGLRARSRGTGSPPGNTRGAPGELRALSLRGGESRAYRSQPVIAFRHGSVPEVVDDGVTGFIVDGLEEAVRTAARIPTLRRQDCRQTFETRFSASRAATDYVNIYRRLTACEGERHSVWSISR